MSWDRQDQVVTTFGTLKQAQNEAFQAGIAHAIDILRNYQESEIADILEVDTKNASLFTIDA